MGVWNQRFGLRLRREGRQFSICTACDCLLIVKTPGMPLDRRYACVHKPANSNSNSNSNSNRGRALHKPE